MSRDELDVLLAELGIEADSAGDVLPALSGLADQVRADAPTRLRDQVLRSADQVRPRGAPTVGAEPVGPVEAFRSQVAVLAGLGAELTADDWDRRAAPYDWTVHELVAHLVGVERYTGAALGLWSFVADPGTEGDHLRRTDATVAEQRLRPPPDTLAEWVRLATAIADHVEAGGTARLADELTYEGWPFHVDSMLVARTFELWTHADDIRRATGQPMDAPPPEVLRAMASVSVGSLEVAVLVVNPGQAGRAFKIVLTGPGGGTWTVGDPGVDPDATLVADVVDYCRVVARRIEPDALAADRFGDAAFVRDLLDASRLLAA